jgi:23S rRNA (guanosine2251-2'-O)-methyltransferase
VRLLVVPERRAALDQLVIHATTLRIPVVELEGGTLTSLAGFDGHQGVALVARPRATADVATILAAAQQKGQAPFVLVLDSLEDPQNFGTLLRTSEAVGVHGVIYPTRRAAPLSPAAIKAAAGATEHLLLAAVDDLPGTLADLHARGVRIVAAEENAPLTYAEADLRGPLALVVGSEGRGISGPVRRRIDLSVRIPMRGKIASLNAAVAGSVLLFAAADQRPMPVTTTPPTPATAELETEAEPEAASVPAQSAPKSARKRAAPKTEADSEAAPEAEVAAKPTRKRAAAKVEAKPSAEATSDAAPQEAPKPARKRATAKPEAEPVVETGASAAARTPRKRVAPRSKTAATNDDGDLLPGD